MFLSNFWVHIKPRYELFSPHYDIKRTRLIYGLNKTNNPLGE